MSLRVGWDLDGIIYDFTEAVRDFIVKRYGFKREELPDPAGWNTWESWPMSKDQFFAFFREGVEAKCIWLYGAPDAAGLATMFRQREQGHTIHIVTHRNGLGPAGMTSTVEWLDAYGVPYDTLTFAKDKTVVPVDVFIEDNVDNALALRAAGVVSVLMTRPWNVSDERAEHVLRVDTFGQFQDIVEDTVKLRARASRRASWEDQRAALLDEAGRAEMLTWPFLLPDCEVPQLVESDRVFEYKTTPWSAPTTERGKLLAEADEIIHGDRNRSYGSPTQNFTDTAEVWSVQLRSLLAPGKKLSPADVARLMVGLKLTRMVAGDKKDNWLDIAGYAACGYEAFTES